MIARADVINKSIRTHNEWGLMPNFAFLSTIYPCELTSTHCGFPKFPEWLGKFSQTRKIMREVKELKSAMGPEITGSKFAVKQDYSKGILDLILYNLNQEGKDGVETVLDIMEHYHLTPDMLKEHLVDLQIKGSKEKDPFDSVPAQTKSYLTRTYNQRHKSSLTKRKAPKRAAAGIESIETEKFDPDIDDAPIAAIGTIDEMIAEDEDEMSEEEVDLEALGLKQTGKGKGKKDDSTKKTKQTKSKK